MVGVWIPKPPFLEVRLVLAKFRSDQKPERGKRPSLRGAVFYSVGSKSHNAPVLHPFQGYWSGEFQVGGGVPSGFPEWGRLTDP